MKKETLFNLIYDWDGELRWRGVEREVDIRDIKRMIAEEVDAYKNLPWYKKLFKR